MRHRLRIYSPYCRAATLIEVLAGLAILGSVTVALLLSRGNLLEQHVAARHKLEAVRIADGLIAGWYAENATPPVDEQGEVEDAAGWRWQTSLLKDDNREENGLVMDVLRVELFDTRSSSPQVAVVLVDLVIPAHLEANHSVEGSGASL